MYIDLHAHPANKSNFIFANAIDDFVQQVEVQLYQKIIALLDPTFSYEQCIFSKRHMQVKDRYDTISKQGAARVVAYSKHKLIFSYTLECGYHRATHHPSDNPEFTLSSYRRLGMHLLKAIVSLYQNQAVNNVEMAVHRRELAV